MEKTYDFQKSEKEILNEWLAKPEFFAPQGQGKPFVMVLPPPNITGSLHLGHALNATTQDILARWHRTKGERVLWIAGTDHAGIATQNAVEKELAKEGKTRHDLTDEEFLARIRQWKEKYGQQIIDQLKRLGASCDWSQLHFTMADDYQAAVKTAFEHYYQKGWIYQGERVINWCPRCQTSLSDLEVEYQPKKTRLYYFRYDKDFPITIATTRPETKFGDTAVAVHPADKRYQKYIGQKLAINLAGVKREILIIADKAIDQKFGAGAVGVTPAHSIVDYELAQKHHLPVIKVIDEFAKMTEETDQYQGLKVKEAREKLAAYLREKNLLEKEEEIDHNLSVCYRCHQPIEPLPSKQWFLQMAELKKAAIEAVKTEKIKFVPAKWKKVCLDWLENLRDWCLSRQIVWGHKIPIAGEKDVLDTWFSSALWPFAVLGWPKKLQKEYYPTTVLASARDIIYLWVCRMIFSSLELTGEIPFQTVYIHPTFFNIEGKRMSKSLGTGVDPLELIEKYGADALRFGITLQNSGGQDMKFSEDAIFAGQKFGNKLWNIARFVNLEITNYKSQNTNKIRIKNKKYLDYLDLIDSLEKDVGNDIDNFRFGQALEKIYHFIWHDFADKKIEELKKDDPSLRAEASEEKSVFMLSAFQRLLDLVEPFMPFVAAAIKKNLPN